MSSKIVVDNSEVDRLLNGLDLFSKQQCLYKALMKTGDEIVKMGRTALSSTGARIDPKQLTGIKKKGDNVVNSVYVTINKHPLNHLFEGGTKPRQYTQRQGIALKKPHSTGAMKSYNFFGTALEQNAQKIEELIEQNITQQLNALID